VALESDLNDAIDDDSLSSDLSASCNCDMAASGVALDALQQYPTLPPSPLPTMLPTLLPTLVPTLAPSPLPTLVPSQLPTPVPTFPPTPLPTLRPSMVPTASPSPVPTVYCSSGQFYVEATVSCELCGIGRYSDTSAGPPWPTTCINCEAGKYNPSQGQGSCQTCDKGKLSTPDRSVCKDCSAGEYSFENDECRKCERGRFAPTAQTGSCVECKPGDRTNNATGSTTCSSCDAGRHSPGPVTDTFCLACPAGTFSLSRSSSCSDCERGKVCAGFGYLHYFFFQI
jgi:hypothetical protein